MSLPSKISFIKDGKILGQDFINVGWWISADRLESEIRRTAKENVEMWNDCDSVSLYDLTFTKSFILSHKSIEECVKGIENIITKAEKKTCNKKE